MYFCIIIWNDDLLCFLSMSRLYLQSRPCLCSSPECTDSKPAQERACQVCCGQTPTRQRGKGRVSRGIFRLQSATSPLDATKSQPPDQWWTHNVWGAGAKNIKGTKGNHNGYLTTFCPLEKHSSTSLNLTSSNKILNIWCLSTQRATLTFLNRIH